MQNQPKVLVIDIETKPMTAHVWGLKDQNIALNQIVEDWSLMAFAAKWLGNEKVTYFDTFKLSEKEVLERVWKLVDTADILITQYGSGFDAPRLNSRFIMYGMKPPSPYKHLDTYRIAKKSFAFTSNKLEYLTDKLCIKYKKLRHKKFPGMSLWTECLKGNKKAWAEMKLYNIHDVLSTEELYLKLKAWAPDSAPRPYNAGDPTRQCEICNESGHVVKAGFHKKKIGTYQRYHCEDCGAWTLGGKIK